MGFISEEIVQRIRSSNNIVDVVGKYISLTQKGKNYFGVCPFHDDHSPSMSVSPEKQIYTCFSCGATGNVITFVMNYEKVNYVEALKILGENVGIKIETSNKSKINNENKEYYDLYEIFTSYYKNNLFSTKGKDARKYLSKRLINEDIIKEFDIGLSLDGNLSQSLLKKYNKKTLIDLDLCKDYDTKLIDTFKNRIMFPIKNNEGNMVGFSARIYNEENESKYINTKETIIFKKGTILYNLYNAKEFIRRTKEAIICEGQMDVIRISSIGIKNVIGLMGTSFTKEQFETIKKLNVKVILNLDQDEAGKNATYTIGNILTQNGIETEVIIFGNFKDSDELISKSGEEAFKKVLKNKVSFIDFKINYLRKNKNLSDSVELAKYINEVLENISKLDDEILKEIKLKELSKEFDISEDILKSKITNKAKVKIINKSNNNIKKKVHDKYYVSEIRIIYLMLHYKEVIKIYEKQLGYLSSERMTNFANEIVNYKNKYKEFEYADFISYVNEIEELTEILKEVMNYQHIENYSDEELDDYINIIKEYAVKYEIEKLSSKMRNSLDVEEKKKIGKKIENMKKEVMKW